MDRATEERFTRFLLTKAVEAEEKAGIDYRKFEGLLNSQGSEGAVGRLISRADYSSGFLKLLEAERVDLTVEALVIESEWNSHFSTSLRQHARRKLQKVGYVPKEYSALTGGASSGSDSDRLPVDVLQRATPEFIWTSVQMFESGYVHHPFGTSTTDYVLISERGNRFPPMAVFGVALSLALDGERIEPKHFSGGESSPCFQLLRAAGYQVVAKGAAVDDEPGGPPEEGWEEGRELWKLHRTRERAPVSKAKKDQYRRRNGKLQCERCGFDPVEEYGTKDAEACIEVHHAETLVSEMKPGHKTSLDDLQCLCANCHRLVHRLLARSRGGNSVLDPAFAYPD
ncbi:HNH endonuclease [Cupriavidus sp. BIC8F]|uniref:HNH endonuclease n=1 Tax=Cupriavidus sp. BIC8F TaxID=3079014 RepID=UPI00291674DB|nr:HNH endonuclease [Cupriavidus sp. BIC8F]